MGLAFDLHVHTTRYSACSSIRPEHLVAQAAQAGLDGLVITEHDTQWHENELEALKAAAGVPGFRLFAGMEYRTTTGDLLVYGLSADQARTFPARLAAGDAIQGFHRLGAVCVAAHPTREGMSFGDGLFALEFDALEVCSVNLRTHEQSLARRLAEGRNLPAVAASDAHLLRDVGRHRVEFTDSINTMSDLQGALRRGRFVPALPGQ